MPTAGGCAPQLPAAERALACELLALYTPRSLEDAASPDAAALAARLASAAQADPATHPTSDPDPPAPASGDRGGSRPADTLLRLASADAGAVLPGSEGSGAAVQAQGARAGEATGPDVRAAALAQVTPALYAALPEVLRAQLVLVRTIMLSNVSRQCVTRPVLQVSARADLQCGVLQDSYQNFLAVWL